MNILIGSVTKFTFRRKLFTAMIFIIIFFSTVFTGFTFRLGYAFAYDSTTVENGINVYVYKGSSKNPIQESVFASYFSEYGFLKYDVAYDDYYNKITSEGYAIETPLNKLTSAADVEKYPGLEKYITADDIASGKKYIVVSTFDVSHSGGKIDVGKTVSVNGVDYLVVGADYFTDENGFSYTYITVDSAELAATYEKVVYNVYTDERVSDNAVNKFAKANGLTVNPTEKNNYLIGFFVLAIAVCAIFVVNVAVLFNAFVRQNSRYYAVFKILGIKTGALLTAMALPCLIIALFAALAGIGADYAIASFTTILDVKTYLPTGGAVAIVLLNVAGALAGASIVCYKQAKALPSESLRSTD